MESRKRTLADGTRGSLMESAMVLFAEKGIDAVSLRDITTRAGTNVSSIKYHFGSREALIDEIAVLLLSPINQERLFRLNELESQRNPSVQVVLKALFDPLVDSLKSSPISASLYLKLIGRLLGDHSKNFPPFLREQLHEITKIFLRLIKKIRPKYSSKDALLRLQFSFGVLLSSMVHSEFVNRSPEENCSENHFAETVHQIIIFCEAGFQQ